MKKNKRCFIKREILNDKNEKIFRGYFGGHLGIKMCPNKWVSERRDAKVFYDGRTAQGVIKRLKLKNCKLEYVE